MKKIKYLFLCLAAVVLVACLTGCSSRKSNQTTQQSQSTTGGTTGTGTVAGESGSGTAAQDTSSYGSDNDMNEGAGAGSTGSTEGETGVLDGLMRDAEDGMGDLLDDGVNSSAGSSGLE